MVKNYWAPGLITMGGVVVLIIHAFYGHSQSLVYPFLLGDLTVLAGNALVLLAGIAMVRQLLGPSFGPLLPGSAKFAAIVTLLVASDAAAVLATGTTTLIGALLVLLAVEPIVRFVLCFFTSMWLYELDGIEAITLSAAMLAVIPLEIIMCCTMGTAMYPLFEGLIPRC